VHRAKGARAQAVLAVGGTGERWSAHSIPGSLRTPGATSLTALISCQPDMKAVLHRADPITTARFFRVLGDPTRLKILQLLTAEERTVGELVTLVGQPQPRISTHLACLRHCGFVTAERQGKEVVYRLALDGLGSVLNEATESLGPIAERLSTCTRIGPEWV
jgi:ArsR family transcriptional regulator, cadmium/lead-responsive transcriptional repressor